ncbi:alpha-N-arabinofuranosidase [Novipirellula artificiosorum]|uniref:non-reducing end alpha-L-arabinofuranosidase n=1 Tax=Novipirellula artificiosorum TaxID=2528016 RepID=A0A5C6DZA0_9BACT|nr:alpha-N-arabinofuranosidase [Novipirellula artificiosorum]TWU42783.1 Intracellular exo-alpha-L-arabinofuranosidase 2 [Novipirellula artificiosorum]
MRPQPTSLLLSLFFGIGLFVSAAMAEDPGATLTLRADATGPQVNPNVYGHFAEHLGRCIYEGIWVGEDSSIPNTRGIRQDVVAALRELEIPVLRWPGGCFADEYHWKDGIGPRENRPKLINTHWGGVVENNHFGTHEFLDLCEQIGAEPYICGNVGSGSVQEMMNWVEYMTSDADSPMANLRRANGRDKPWKVPYFGVGNESWGCGGNMRPEFYADLYRRYNTFVKNYSGNRIYRIACGSNGSDFNWTEVLMDRAGRRMNGLSLHYYTLPTGDWGRKGSATEFDEAQYHATLFQTLRMDELIAKHGEIMDRHDPQKRVGMIIDEWGIWTDVEPGTNPGFLYQQNSLRDAIIAGLNFHIFHRHADRVAMTNIAQTINVLQAMILTDKQAMLRTPTFHVFEMFKVHQGGTVLPIELKTPKYTLDGKSIPTVSASATRRDDGVVSLSLVNTHPTESIRVACAVGEVPLKSVSGRVLTAPAVNSHNTFDHPETVKPTEFTAALVEGDTLNVDLPSKSVVVLTLQ